MVELRRCGSTTSLQLGLRGRGLTTSLSTELCKFVDQV